MKTSSRQITYILPGKKWNGFNWHEIWLYRELVVALVRRELQSRYRQTVASVIWVLGQPLLTMIVMSMVLTHITSESQQGIPTPLFVYSGLIPWAYINQALYKITLSFVQDPGLVTRVYFPRILIPLAVAIAALADFAITFLLLPVLLIMYGTTPSLTLLALPLVIGLMIVAVFGIGLLLASFNAEFRDVAFAVPFLLQLGLFVTPIFYSTESIELPWRYLYALNPFVGVIEAMRWSLLNPSNSLPLDLFLISALSAFSILIGGLYIFQRREPNMADVI